MRALPVYQSSHSASFRLSAAKFASSPQSRSSWWSRNSSWTVRLNRSAWAIISGVFG